MTKAQKNREVLNRVYYRFGIEMDVNDAETLRLADLTLHRWYELECGDGNSYGSWAIERDDTTGLPYMANYRNDGITTRHRIADREAGAIKRVARVCTKYGLSYYLQTDPRGASLYISTEPMTDSGYSSQGCTVTV